MVTEKQAVKRFPEVELINDKGIREETIHAIAEGHEDGFWVAPAATSYKHHNMYCCGKHGLWIHTKMVFTAYSRIVQSLEFTGELTSLDVDCGRAAVLLHDLRKHGGKYNKGDSATKDHDVQCAEWLAQNTALPQEVLQAVASHMGPWYHGPEPRSVLDKIVHRSDMTGSDKNVTCGLYKPHKKLVDHYPSLPQANL